MPRLSDSDLTVEELRFRYTLASQLAEAKAMELQATKTEEQRLARLLADMVQRVRRNGKGE